MFQALPWVGMGMRAGVARRKGADMADEELRRRVDAYVDEVWEDVVEDIRSLVRIDSVEDLSAAEPGRPWGPEAYRALAKGLEIAGRLGLEPHDCEGYIGYADLPGLSERQVATIAHTDIVPAGLGWTVPALDVTRKDGYLLGRGVLDDKGPFVLSLYAAKFFVDQVARTGERLPYTLRCIVGNNEETLMGDLDWYLEHHEAPAFAFSPDADFPLICGEKGIMHGHFACGPLAGGSLVELDGGTVANAIPGLASATVRADAAALPAADGITVEGLGEGLVRLTAHGKGGHASLPAGTVNAIGLVVTYLLDNVEVSGEEASFLSLLELACTASDGSKLGIASADELFGPLTCIGGTIRTGSDGSFVQTVDCRFPTSTTGDQVAQTLRALAARHGATFELDHVKEPFYIDPSCPEISALLSTYNEYTGRDAKAFTIGGGTYARKFPRACAFGPHDPQVPDPSWVGMEHGPDEGVSEECLRRALKIYIVGIARLMELEL